MAQGTGVASGGNGGSPVFRGVTQLALDAKGRLAIPAKHRDALTRGTGFRCVVVQCRRHHRRSIALPARLSARRLGADPGAPHVAVVVQSTRSAPAAAARRPRRRRRDRWRRPHPRPAGAAPLRGSRHSTSCSSARATSSSCGTRRAGRTQTARAIAFPAERAAARARRLLALMADGVHVPVLLEEAVAALAVTPDGIYVDATFGRGGHARAILARSARGGRLVALDRDPDAERARARASTIRASRSTAPGSRSCPTSSRSSASRASTACCSTSASPRRRSTIAARGFSLRFDGPLDMRMDPTRGESAAEFLARADERELTEVIRDYGEERFAQSIARAIVAARARAPVVRTRQLAADRGPSRRRAHAG